jgi:hypothetical protein
VVPLLEGAERGQGMRLKPSPVASRASKCAGKGTDACGVISGYWGHVPLVMPPMKEPLRLSGHDQDCYRRETDFLRCTTVSSELGQPTSMQSNKGKRRDRLSRRRANTRQRVGTTSPLKRRALACPSTGRRSGGLRQTPAR